MKRKLNTLEGGRFAGHELIGHFLTSRLTCPVRGISSMGKNDLYELKVAHFLTHHDAEIWQEIDRPVYHGSSFLLLALCRFSCASDRGL